MDIASADINRQMQHLISQYKVTGNDSYRIDAEYLRSEFESWWDSDESQIVPPAEI